MQVDHYQVDCCGACLILYSIRSIESGLSKVKKAKSNKKFIELQICFDYLTRLNIGYTFAVRRFPPLTSEREIEHMSTILEV